MAPPKPAASKQGSIGNVSEKRYEKTEHWLDQGTGRAVLRRRQFADLLVEAMHHFDQSRYELGCYVIMPNHVHAIVRPTDSETYPLESIVGSWKQFSARRINAALKEREELWQEETYDHLYRVVLYIGRNPGKDTLPASDYVRWTRPEWIALGWDFEV